MIIDLFYGLNRLAFTSEAIPGMVEMSGARVSLDRQNIRRLLDKHESLALRYDDDEQATAAYECFKREFILITAAGGLVLNDSGECLMIYRNGRWDLPKGHLEEGETLEVCAMREVEEETGVHITQEVKAQDKICYTEHIYKLHGKWELKRTHWYSMRSSDTTLPKPQTEEGIESVEWCDVEYIEARLLGSFPTVLRVVANSGISRP